MRFLENAHLSLFFSQEEGRDNTRALLPKEREREEEEEEEGIFTQKQREQRAFIFLGYRVLPKIALIPKKGPSSSFGKGGSPR